MDTIKKVETIPACASIPLEYFQTPIYLNFWGDNIFVLCIHGL